MSNWTLIAKGSKQVPILGLDDKREITALLTVSASGHLLPPQLLYKGTTEKCHPAGVSFPSSWDIWHSANHWSNETTMLRFIDTVINPYMEKQRKDYPGKTGLCIFDIYSAHLCSSVLSKLKEANLVYVTIPAGCTSELQPLDLSVNHLFKSFLKDCFQNYYANFIQSELLVKNTKEPCKLNLQLTHLKPLHAKWVMDAFALVSNRPSVIKKGFRKAGILSDVDLDSDATTCSFHSDDDATTSADIDKSYSEVVCMPIKHEKVEQVAATVTEPIPVIDICD